jgi:O-antigen biosynthesis protein
VTTPHTAAGPRVSLLIPNRNNEPALDLVLGRLAQNTTYPNVELIVVDDGSTDRSLEILRNWRDSGRFPGDMQIVEREPSGVVEALNAGLRAASGEIVVQLDADASVETSDWLQRMLGLFLPNPAIGVVTPKVVFDFGLVHAYGVNAVGPAGLHDRGTEVIEPLGRRRLHQRVRRFPERPGDLGQRAAEVDCGIGCCMMYRRDVALEVGGYDPGWQPVWFDDLDLCLSIRRAGYKVFFLPDVRVIHRLSLRHTRKDTRSVRRRAIGAAAGRGLELLPQRWRESIIHAANLDRPPPEDFARLRHHYDYWRDKWGWDPLNPDMEIVQKRYGDTELWWARDAERRAAGEKIVAAFEARRDRTSVALEKAL